MLIDASPVVVPTATVPGHEAMNGTRCPPSNSVPFLPRKSAFAAKPEGAAGPLSEQKIKSVLDSSRCFRNSATTAPTDSSSTPMTCLYASAGEFFFAASRSWIGV